MKGILRRERTTDPGALALVREGDETARCYEAVVMSLLMLRAERPLHAVLVTSTQPGEGKTTVTMNLVFTLGRAGKKILVIDADLRKPRLHTALDLPKAPGFADLLAGSAQVNDVIHAVRLGRDHSGSDRTVDAITSGAVTHQTVEALSTPGLPAILESLRARYDMVLIDTPPVLAVGDALLLAPIVDGILLVMNAGMGEREVKRAVERLSQAGGRMLGVVINRFEESLDGPSFQPYFRYYSVPPDRR